MCLQLLHCAAAFTAAWQSMGAPRPFPSFEGSALELGRHILGARRDWRTEQSARRNEACTCAGETFNILEEFKTLQNLGITGNMPVIQ